MAKAMHFSTVSLAELALKGMTPVTELPRPIVLVVDDETVIADTLGVILGQAGLTVMVAYDGQSALELAKLVPPDLLLTDVVMPGMTGVDLAVAVTRTFPDCKVLLFSGQAATATCSARRASISPSCRNLSIPPTCSHGCHRPSNCNPKMGRERPSWRRC